MSQIETFARERDELADRLADMTRSCEMRDELVRRVTAALASATGQSENVELPELLVEIAARLRVAEHERDRAHAKLDELRTAIEPVLGDMAEISVHGLAAALRGEIERARCRSRNGDVTRIMAE